MSRRSFAIIGVGFAALAVSGIALFVVRQHCPITREAFDRIETGMTEAEASEIIGLPPGNHATRPLMMVVSTAPCGMTQEEWGEQLFQWRALIRGRKPPWFDYEHWQEWVGNEGIICVRFDSQGRLAAKEFMAVRPKSETPLELLRRWLRAP